MLSFKTSCVLGLSKLELPPNRDLRALISDLVVGELVHLAAAIRNKDEDIFQVELEIGLGLARVEKPSTNS